MNGELTRYWDRRRYIRVPVSGPAQWTSGRRRGYCELRDISPGGAGLRMPLRNAVRLGPQISLEVELSPEVTWHLARNARVVRRVPDDDGLCVVGVESSPDEWDD